MKKEKVYFVGICGTAMAPIANMFKNMGYIVEGSDKGFFPPVSLYLEQSLIHLKKGYKAEHITDDILFAIIGMAIPESNPEFLEIKKRHIKYYSYPEILAKFLIKKNSIVVVGEYGKTTITSLLSFILSKGGFNPSFMFGGVSLDFEDSVYLSNSDYSVVEGDEYSSAFFDKRSKFLHYKPKYVLLTSVVWDHVNLFETFDDYIETFKKFISMIPEDGLLVVNKEGENVEKVLDSAKCKIIYYSLSVSSADYFAKSYSFDEDGIKFELQNGLKFENKNIIGEHNISNFIGSIALSLSLGMNGEEVTNILSQYKGVKRRLEVRFKNKEFVVIDDFAHAPAKIKASIDAVRHTYPKDKYRLISIFEPHTQSIKDKQTLSWFKDVFMGSDKVIITDIKNERKSRVVSSDIVNLVKESIDDALYIPNIDIADYILKVASIGDVYLFMSSGSFSGAIGKSIEMLS
ncbi:Mur ligase family protein [Patescibacteria group bacterium]|nr:Mur ligase family protein [Patescibacteria group bacterium]